MDRKGPKDEDPRDGTSLPASEEDSDLIDEEDAGPPPQSWPGRGPGTIPPPG